MTYWKDLTVKPDMKSRIDAMRKSLQHGVRPIAVKHLFVTKPHVADKMVTWAEFQPGMSVLEPSAGTGAILQAIQDRTAGFHPSLRIEAVEIDRELAGRLRHYAPCGVMNGDFLGVRPKDYEYVDEPIPGGLFDRILMNPPFDHGKDIKHIKHALEFLKPDGLLIGICANGPAQQKEVLFMSHRWEVLKSGTFAHTGVESALFVIQRTW